MKTIAPYYQTGNALLYQGDCLDILPQIDTSSVHMVLCDLPYGTTECPWDSVISLVPLWRHLKRVIIGMGAMVFTASQPFTTQLIQSNTDQFRYEWIWVKNKSTGFVHSKNKPMKRHESVLVFSYGACNHESLSANRCPYYPQGVRSIAPVVRKKKTDSLSGLPSRPSHDDHIVTTENYPHSILNFDSSKKTDHPTEKPVELMEYLIRTYTQEGETVLDMTCGSGTTLVAALQSKRRCIGIELDKEYCEVTRRRILRFEPFKITKSV